MVSVISYRALKKLIGETSLERKCRFLFGLALLVLITTSFYVYALRTRALVEGQQVAAAKALVPWILQLRHHQLFIRGHRATSVAGDQAAPAPEDTRAAPEAVPDQEQMAQLQQFEKGLNDSPEFAAGAAWRLINVATESPESELGFEAMRRFRDESREQNEYWAIREDDDTGSRQLLYYEAIRPTDSCLTCHQKDLASLMQLQKEAFPDPVEEATETPQTQRPPLMAIARVAVSMEHVEAQLSRNRAVLLASGIVTSFLAMMAAYLIVRYIIVKPVLHLKDVSDEIARGNLNLRAEISTGDEFEELSHAFNRMLRHMMTVNDELRGLNLSLDGKVDQLARANMELFNNNKLKDDFLATMSHELRTPLNSILGFSDILQSALNLDERQKRYVHNIQTSGQSLMVQINDLLDLAKIESGKMDLHLSDVVLSDIIEQQVQQMGPLADRKNIDLRVDPPLQVIPTLFQDRGKISQILNNLLSNAIKFTPEGGRVRISSRLLGDGQLEFSVEDTGIGIPLHEQEQIFEKFRQGSTAPGGRDHVKREYEGTGLGLSIVRELSRLMGGDVFVESEFGKGSLFVVRLPVVATVKPPVVEIPAEPRSGPGPGRITSVDLMSNRKKSGDPESGQDSAGTRPPVATIAIFQTDSSSRLREDG